MSTAEREMWNEREFRRGTDNESVLLRLPLVPLRSLVAPRRKVGHLPASVLGARRLAREFDATIRNRDDLGVPSGEALLRSFLQEHSFATDPDFPDVVDGESSRPLLSGLLFEEFPTDEMLARARTWIGGSS